MTAPDEPKVQRKTQADLEILITDAQRLGQPDTVYATTIFKRGVLGAAQTIVDLALMGSSERIRFQAATYVVERVMGRIQDNPPKSDDAPYDTLLAECVSSIDDDTFVRIKQEMAEEKNKMGEQAASGH